jgi:hypothetical protein
VVAISNGRFHAVCPRAASTARAREQSCASTRVMSIHGFASQCRRVSALSAPPRKPATRAVFSNWNHGRLCRLALTQALCGTTSDPVRRASPTAAHALCGRWRPSANQRRTTNSAALSEVCNDPHGLPGQLCRSQTKRADLHAGTVRGASQTPGPCARTVVNSRSFSAFRRSARSRATEVCTPSICD